MMNSWLISRTQSQIVKRSKIEGTFDIGID